MKIYLNKPKEDWIVDRFVDEWNEHNKSFTTKNIFSQMTLLRENSNERGKNILACVYSRLVKCAADIAANNNDAQKDPHRDLINELRKWTFDTINGQLNQNCQKSNEIKRQRK